MVNGTTYSNAEEMEAAGIVLSSKETAYSSDGSTHTAAIYGSINLPRNRDNEVSVTSKKRYYKVVFEEYVREFGNDVFIYTSHATSTPVYVEYGEDLPAAPHAAGSEDVIDADNYTLSDWYDDYNGNVFYNVVDVTVAKVPANDVTLHAFWKKNPNVVLGEPVKVEKITDDDATGKVFTFEAYIHEHLAGNVTITGNGEGDMTITLTDRMNNQFENGEIIRIREVGGEDDDWHNTSISTMAKLGIVKGRKANYFIPDAFITRAEFATICARFDDAEFEVVDNFTDVSGHWAEHDIHESAAHGWIRGYEDGTFKPDQFITRAEAMTMINRVLNRVPETADDLLDDMVKWPDNSDKSAWYYLAVQEATNSHDYEMKNHIYEKWTVLKEVADWKRYE